MGRDQLSSSISFLCSEVAKNETNTNQNVLEEERKGGREGGKEGGRVKGTEGGRRVRG